MPIIQLSDIDRIEYEPRDKDAFKQALDNGETKIIVCLKDDRRINVTKPYLIQKEDGTLVYLKIPNPCNHKPQISYIETAIARLARELLLQKGVLVPEYEVIELNLSSPLVEGLSTTPCCLIEALDHFISFGVCGDNIVVDPSKISFHRLSEKNQNSRKRQSDLLFSKEFAAFAAVTYFIGNNDPHQENFGTANVNEKSCFTAIDFDMAPMPFLVDKEIFGPYNIEIYTKQQHYHCDDGGRYTSRGIDLSSFPTSPINCQIPDNWFTEWCKGFDEGLNANENKAIFRNAVLHTFQHLANLPDFFFEKTFEKIVSKQKINSNPELRKLLTDLADYFKNYTQKLRKEVTSQINHLAQSFHETPYNRSMGNSPLCTPGSFFSPPANRQKNGGSPEMNDIFFPPPGAA